MLIPLAVKVLQEGLHTPISADYYEQGMYKHSVDELFFCRFWLFRLFCFAGGFLVGWMGGWLGAFFCLFFKYQLFFNVKKTKNVMHIQSGVHTEDVCSRDGNNSVSYQGYMLWWLQKQTGRCFAKETMLFK